MMDFTIIKSLIIFILMTQIACDSRTPICDICTCEKTPPNVDCSSKKAAAVEIYKNTTWWDSAKNTTYPVGAVNLDSVELGDLKNKFPVSSLSKLDLRRNFIRRIDPGYFSGLQQMKTLILSDNDIDRLRPETFKGILTDGDNYPLRSLTTLKLDHNKIHTLNDDVFEHIEEHLEVLDLSYNPLKVLDQPTIIALGSIIYLKELYLSFTNLKQLPDHLLHTPKYLRVLDLSGNNFVEIPLTLVDSHALEILYFNNNPIVSLNNQNGFPNITTLKVVHMCDMLKLENITDGGISGLGNLEELHICDNIKLNYIDPKALSRADYENIIWPPIKKLYLQNNKLGRLDMTLLAHWEKLTALDLRFNAWTCECENQWMVETLMPVYLRINETQAKQLRCAAPIEMEGKTFYQEYMGNKTMRCLDLYGAQPDKDASLLVGLLVALLILIPLVLFGIYAYQRNWFGFCDRSPASFSRQFYSRTGNDDDRF